MSDWVEVVSKGMAFLVARDGRVRSQDRITPYANRYGRISNMRSVGRPLTPCRNNMGYLEIKCANGNRKKVKHLHHRLIAAAFVAGYSSELTVNHKNGNKLDNRPENLEWITKGANTEHAWRSGLVPLIGEENPTSKLTSKKVAYIKKLLLAGVPKSCLAVIADVSVRLITKIEKGDAWAHVPPAKAEKPIEL